jgi:cytochrome c556
MKTRILIAVLCLLVGALVGSGVARYSAQRHQHTRAVMWLTQIHLDNLATEARVGQCQSFDEERGRLGRLQEELIQAFPLAYRQDADFRSKADALGSAARNARSVGTDCAAAMAQVKSIRGACEACHRLYR